MSWTKVAVVQAGSVENDTDATLEKARRLMADCAGADVMVFPEAFVGGYPRGKSFGAVVGSRTEEGRAEFQTYFEGAVEVPGPAVTFLGDCARESSAYLVMGVVERDGGTLYCTVLFFGPDGTYLGKHRKVMPTASERLIWGFGDGSTLPVFETPFGRLGALICWENYLPLARAAMYAKGIQLYCAPTADARDSWLATVRHIAVEGRCFVLSANQVGPSCRGGSCIVDPFGTVVAGPCFESEGVLRASLDLGLVVRGKFDLDVVGHYARPDIFRLVVDEREKTAVEFE